MYASTASKENTCEYCNYVAKNLRALTAHHRGCALKKQYEQAKVAYEKALEYFEISDLINFHLNNYERYLYNLG